eukprot:1400694-Rhodomonas_salina.1
MERNIALCQNGWQQKECQERCQYHSQACYTPKSSLLAMLCFVSPCCASLRNQTHTAAVLVQHMQRLILMSRERHAKAAVQDQLTLMERGD